MVIARAAHPIQETARSLGPALLVVTFDAIFAFAALHYAKVPMLRQFGFLLIVGVAAICLNSIVGTLAVLGIREYKSPTKGHDFREARWAVSSSGSAHLAPGRGPARSPAGRLCRRPRGREQQC